MFTIYRSCDISILKDVMILDYETREERFTRIAEARTNKIIDMIKLLGNCSVKSNYAYTTDQVDAIFEVIENELKYARKRFDKETSGKSTFRLR